MSLLKIGLIISAVWSALIGLGSMSVGESLDRQVKTQKRLLLEMRQFKNRYETLLPVNDEFEGLFVQLGEETDLLELHRLLRLRKSGVDVSPDQLVLASVDTVKESGQDIQLFKVCVQTGSNAFVFEAGNVSEALHLVEGLSRRQDVSFGTVRLKPEDSRVAVLLDQLCVYLRD